MKRVFVVLALLAVLSGAAFAQKPVTQKESITIKATIVAIDHDHRVITFKDKDGEMEDVYVGPEIKRFDELKVGDQVTFKYTASAIYELRKPGEPVPSTAVGDPAVVRNPTEKPSGSVTQQVTGTVTVQAVDAKTGALSIRTEDGRSMSFKVEDKGKLKDVKPGDHIVITYTEAVAISVE
jgi:Cu/Ag efflux protein CusF